MLWTPRGTHIKSNRGSASQVYTPSRKLRFTFKPKAIEFKPPPPVLQAKPQQEKKESLQPAAELEKQAEELVAEAVAYDKAALAASASPPLSMQLGLLVQCKEDFIKKCIAQWDARGKGEFVKGEFRINLRKVGLDPTAADSDALVRGACVRPNAPFVPSCPPC